MRRNPGLCAARSRCRYHIDSIKIVHVGRAGNFIYVIARYESTKGGQKAFGVNLVVAGKTANGWRIVVHEAVVPDPATAVHHLDIPGRARNRGSPLPAQAGQPARSYFGGGGVKISRLPDGSGFGLGFGAFFASFLPLSLLPMRESMTQKGLLGKGRRR
ncbi:MAG: hypothetical protein KGM96_15120 [Acidobacteriota bacterium]|nr:hypothetical protein [Acidobacteriota bacterium]